MRYKLIKILLIKALYFDIHVDKAFNLILIRLSIIYCSLPNRTKIFFINQLDISILIIFDHLIPFNEIGDPFVQ